jgi:hypothetical protein
VLLVSIRLSHAKAQACCCFVQERQFAFLFGVERSADQECDLPCPLAWIA